MSPLPPMTMIFMWISWLTHSTLIDLGHRPAGQLVRVVGHVNDPDPARDAQGHDLDDRPAGREHHPRLAVHPGRVHLAVPPALAEHPGQEPGGPVPPAAHDPRRRHLAPAVRAA